MRSIAFTLLLALAVLSLAAQTAVAEDVVAIRNARVIPIVGDEIPDGVVIIRDGRIDAVGAGLEVPWNARVIDAKGGVVTPGLVNPHSQDGMGVQNERMSVTPFITVVDSIDPESNAFRDALRQGVTTILIAPGNQTVVGGQAAIVHPVGRYVEEMLSFRDAGMKLVVSPRRNVSRMTQMAELRRSLDGALQYRDDRRRAVEKAKKEKKEEPPVDPKQEAMLRLLDGKLPAIFWCDKAMDVHAAVGIMEAYGFTGFLVLGAEGWKAASFVAKKKLGVVLPPVLEYWDRDPDTMEEVRRRVAPPFKDAGVPFGLAVGGGRIGLGLFWHRAATLVSQGVARNDALRAITIDAAKVIGLADRIGSIEKGKDADLVVWTDDPLGVTSWVSVVLIGGKVVYEREKDEQLKEILAAEVVRAELEKKKAEEEEKKKKEEAEKKKKDKETDKEKKEGGS